MSLADAEAAIFDRAKIETDKAYREDLRYRFITDHFFAGRVLGFTDFTQRAHGPAVKLYFPKNPKIPMGEQHVKKMRLHLDPRMTFKTTLNRIDSVQWVCAFPEIVTILNESATQPLAMAISTAVSKAFYQPRGAAPTLLQLLYPELAVSKEPEPSWDTPVRHHGGPGDLDSTLDFTSPKSQQSGWHPIIIKSDDVEDTENSGIGVSADVRQHIIDKCDQNENLLREGGYKFITGTRYHPFDWYGSCLKRAARNPANWETLVRCSVTRRDGARILPGDFPDEDDVILEFPEFSKLSYQSLRDIYDNNYESFMCQQQNDPQGGSVSRFEERFYDAARIEPGRIPREGEMVMCWRPRYGVKPATAKFSEGVVGRVSEDGRIFILDAWQGSYSPSTEASKIVQECKRHDVESLMIVAVPGSEFVESHVRNELIRRNQSVRLHSTWWEEDESTRNAEMEAMEPLIRSGRLMFSAQMGKAMECRTQFVSFELVEIRGMIECVAKLANKIPMSIFRANMTEEELEYARRRREDAQFAQYMHHEGLQEADDRRIMQENAHVEAMAKVSNWSLPPMPGGLDG